MYGPVSGMRYGNRMRSSSRVPHATYPLRVQVGERDEPSQHVSMREESTVKVRTAQRSGARATCEASNSQRVALDPVVGGEDRQNGKQKVLASQPISRVCGPDWAANLPRDGLSR